MIDQKSTNYFIKNLDTFSTYFLEENMGILEEWIICHTEVPSYLDNLLLVIRKELYLRRVAADG